MTDSMTSQRREQILENYRWLFGQEVQLITFQGAIPQGKYPNEYQYTAAILPKMCSLKSLTQCDINEKILIKSEIIGLKGQTYTEQVVYNLLEEIEKKIGEILEPSNGLFQINKLAISHRMQLEPVESSVASSVDQTTEATESIILEEREEQGGTTVAGGKLRITEMESGDLPDEKTKTEKKRIWRVVAYTASGEPCIEEHEPESPNADPPLLRNADNRLTEGVFTPGTSVVSNSDTITAPVDEHSDCTNKLGEANNRIEQLEQELLNLATNEGTRFDDLQQKYLTLETTSTEQTEQIKKYKAAEGKTEAVIIAMENEMINLENSLREAESARDAEIRLRTEAQAQLKREGWRAARTAG